MVERTGGLSAYQAIYCIDSLAKGLNKAFQRYRLGKVISFGAAAVGLLAASLALYAAFRSTDVVAEPVQPIPKKVTTTQEPKTIFLQDSIDTEVPTMQSDDFFEVQ